MYSSDLDDYLEGVLLSERAILERVDEYSLYCHYLGFKPSYGVKFKSPIRNGSDVDSNSSFSIFPTTKILAEHKILWKDNGNGKSGNVFTLIGLLHDCKDPDKIYRIIDRDFNLGFGNGAPIEYKLKPIAIPDPYVQANIRVKSKPFTQRELAYWASFGISKSTLEYFNVTSVDCYWSYDDQRYPKSHGDMCFAYRIWSKYKLYRPLAKNKADKFRNSFTEKHIEGFCQLKRESKLVVVTKSLKDVMVFYEYGIEAIASHSESNILPQFVLDYLHAHYEHVVIWYDNDGKTQAEKYEEPKVYVPIESGEKDPSDYRRRYGHEATHQLIYSTLNQWIAA